MNIKEFQKKSDIISSKLDKGELADAITMSAKLIEDEGITNYKDDLDRVKETYRYLLHYFAQGVVDNSRSDIFAGLINSMKDILQKLEVEKKMADSSEIYYSTSRICRHRNIRFRSQIDKLEDLTSNIALAESAGVDTHDLRIAQDALLRELFDYIWTSFISKETANEITTYIRANEESSISGYLLASLIMSLLSIYDSNKFTILLDIYDTTDNDKLAARSLVGIVMAVDKYKERISQDKEIKNRLELLSDSILTYSRIRIVVKEMIKARDTDRLTTKMREEVIPELMKMRPDIMNKFREAAEDPESMSIDENPDWEKMLEKSGIADKLREFTEMQMEGADMMMVSFSNLKSFPFFRNVNSWFLPFSADHPSISMEETAKQSLSTLLEMNKLVCDSDKYSLFLAFASMPASQRNMMFGQFETQMSQLNEELKERQSKEGNAQFSGEAVLFIRDLYRFFRLFNKKEEFYDPFGHPLNFIGLPYLNSMLMDEEMISVIGEFYYKRGYYKDALSLLERIEKTRGLEVEYWEKIGFINQKLGDYQAALNAYQKAELLGDSGSWLLKNLALVNIRIGNYRAAAHYYEALLEKDSENVSLLKNLAFCNIQIGSYEDALKYLYHVDYIVPDDKETWRQLAWTELLMGNFEKSETYFNRIPEEDRSATDYLNMGHLSIIKGNSKDAINNYRKSYQSNSDKFIDSFNTDRWILDKFGIDKLTQNLIIEALIMGND